MGSSMNEQNGESFTQQSESQNVANNENVRIADAEVKPAEVDVKTTVSTTNTETPIPSTSTTDQVLAAKESSTPAQHS